MCILFHAWEKWGEPEKAHTDNQPSYIQGRKCSTCGEVEYRHVIYRNDIAEQQAKAAGYRAPKEPA